MKPYVGSLGHTSNGFDHLPLTNIEITDPRARNLLLLAAWEGETPSSIPLPHGASIFLSKRCSDSPIGLAYTTALVRAAVIEHTEARRVFSAEQHATGS